MGKGKKNNRGKSKSKKLANAKEQSAGASTSVDDVYSIMSASATCDQNYEITTDDLKRCLYHNLKVLYNVALERILNLGYKKENVQIALYMNGYIRGVYNDVLTNIMCNAINFINNAQMPDLPPKLYSDMSSRINTELATLVNESARQTGWREFEGLCHLVTFDFLGEVPTPISPPCAAELEQFDQDQGNGSSGESEEPNQNENVREKPRDDGNDPVNSVRNEIIMKMKEHQKSRLEFEEESRRKLWTMIRNTNTYLLHSFNHNMLREQVLAEMSGLRADMEAWSLSHSESEKELVEATKIEKKENKEAISLQKQLEQIQKLQMGEQNKESELEQEQLQIKTAEKEIKVRLAEQEKDMENYQDYVWEEERLQRFAKENLEIEKSSVQGIQLKIECLTDDSRRKEDELSELQASSQNADYEELYELFYKVEEVHKEGCVICLRNKPTYILLPCGHKILCEICANANIVGKRCPDCDVEIKGSLHVFGPTS